MLKKFVLQKKKKEITGKNNILLIEILALNKILIEIKRKIKV